MKKIHATIALLAFLVIGGLKAQEDRQVLGTVSDGNNPLQDVQISVQGKEGVAFTNAEGKYSIEAEVGDLLKYSYNGMKDYIVRVEDVTRYQHFGSEERLSNHAGNRLRTARVRIPCLLQLSIQKASLCDFHSSCGNQ